MLKLMQLGIEKFADFKCGDVYCITPVDYQINCSLCGRKLPFAEFPDHFRQQHLHPDNSSSQVQKTTTTTPNTNVEKVPEQIEIPPFDIFDVKTEVEAVEALDEPEIETIEFHEVKLPKLDKGIKKVFIAENEASDAEDALDNTWPENDCPEMEAGELEIDSESDQEEISAQNKKPAKTSANTKRKPVKDSRPQRKSKKSKIELSASETMQSSNESNEQDDVINALHFFDASSENHELSNFIDDLVSEDASNSVNTKSSYETVKTIEEKVALVAREIGASKERVKRKRQLKREKWIDEMAKSARARGLEGTGRKGRPIAKREMGMGCIPNCRNNCHNKISNEMRQMAFSQFWNLGNMTAQRRCISNWIQGKKPKSFMDDCEANKKTVTHTFALPNSNGELVTVCRTMFLSTLDISYNWVRTVDNKKAGPDNSISFESDMRGKHLNRPCRVAEKVKDIVRDHIGKYPVIEAYYCWQNMERKYLEEGLTMSKMYRMYRDELQKNGVEQFVSQQMYRKIFYDEYNYEFYYAKKDRCERCESFDNLGDNQSVEQQTVQYKHIHNKSMTSELMKMDKERASDDNTICVINFDLQKVLTAPKAAIGPLYYLSKLCIWNFTIYDLSQCTGQCNVWNETIGFRGSNEIASLLWKYFKDRSEMGVREFILYSDSCGELNRNTQIFSMFVKASLNFGITITHRFLEVGHAQCDVDSMHVRIEHHSRKKSVYTQQQWCKLMAETKVPNPYDVHEVRQDEIYDFTDLSHYFEWENVCISDVREICIYPYLDKVLLKYDFETQLKEISILNDNVSSADIEQYILKPAYDAKIELSAKKKQDLRTAIKKGLIPEEFQQFYYDIIGEIKKELMN